MKSLACFQSINSFQGTVWKIKSLRSNKRGYQTQEILFNNSDRFVSMIQWTVSLKMRFLLDFASLTALYRCSKANFNKVNYKCFTLQCVYARVVIFLLWSFKSWANTISCRYCICRDFFATFKDNLQHFTTKSSEIRFLPNLIALNCLKVFVLHFKTLPSQIFQMN